MVSAATTPIIPRVMRTSAKVNATRLAAKRLGSGATHVALCNKIGPYFRHWCKVLAAKVVKDAKTIRRKDDKSVSEIVAISRHSERLAKESSDTNNLKQLQGIKINLTETAHASMPLGIFASKSISRKINVVEVGTPPYDANLSCWHSVLKLLLARNCHSYCCRRYEFRSSLPELATRPQFRNANLHKKVAFTLAEVLITLGIIGVVAAMTLPTVIQNYQKQETVTRLKSTYSVLNQVYKISIAENGEPENWVPVGEISVEEYFNKYFKPYIKILKMCETYKDCGYKTQTPWIMLEGSQSQTSIGKYDNWVTCVLPNGTVILYMSFINENHAETTHTIVDLNGAKGPNRFGRDVFRFDRIKNIGFVPSGYNSTNIDCTKTTSGAGCAAKIMKDNWQISDDYPW